MRGWHCGVYDELSSALRPTGGAYARVMLRVPVADATSGFRAFRAATLEAVDLDHMRADVEEASARLLRIIDEENADVLVGYDWHGGYGHPDHIMVHRVVHAAAAQRPGVALWEATMNRDRVRQRMQAAFDAGFMKEEDKWDVDGPADDGNPFGSLESEISLMVDVRAHAARKKESVKCHASQVTDSSFFLSMPDDAFVDAFGWEWFIKPGDASPMREGFIV